MRIRDEKNSDPGWTKFGSGMEKFGSGMEKSLIRDPDPQHCVLYLSARVAVLRPPSAVAQPDELRQVGPNRKGEKNYQLK
jgi:hypothetical protein